VKKILVIDDEESVRFTFEAFLSREGHEVLTVEDYASTLEVISKTGLDLIFADIILGDGHTGIDVLREVKNRGMHCPVIMITGEPNVETASNAVRLGAFDYLPKPVQKEILLRITRHALHQKTLLDEKDELEAENEMYRHNLEAIFRSVKDAIITVGDDLHVIEANEATKSICGLPPGEIIGKRFTEVVKQCNKSCYKVLSETLQTKEIIKDYRVECRRQDRHGQVAVLTTSPLRDRNSRFMGAVLVVRDITRLTGLERELKERHKFHNMIGKSRRMQEIYKLLEDLADTETTVLITGESGTGKELMATALHYEGNLAGKPLITINCSALAENLLESELFGHVKGAFTGAVKDKTGRFQMADEGTIFLDEIGDISPRIQLKLLRFLQEKEFERVGDSTLIKVDVRIIAATNRDLKEEVRSGEFREDLYYRLKVVEIGLPPLRERSEDIPLLARHFVTLFNSRFKKTVDDMSNEVLPLLMRYPWPGNIRELEHAMEHAFVLCHGRTITVDHLPSEMKEYPGIEESSPEISSVNEPREIVRALDKTDWNKAKAARLLGIRRPTIYQKIKEYKLARPLD